MGRGDSEGRVPSLVMAAAVEICSPESYLLSFIFDVLSTGHLA
jgi:hypothetical protein